jgi:hypothetical protein
MGRLSKNSIKEKLVSFIAVLKVSLTGEEANEDFDELRINPRL